MLRDTRRGKLCSAKRWKKLIKTGRLNLHQDLAVPTVFEVSWKRSNGKYGRRRFQADSVDRALERAPIEAGLEPDLPQLESVLISEAFEMTLGQTSRGEESRREWLYDQRRFLKWLLKHYPDCNKWCLITRRIVRQYLATFEGRSDNRKRIAMQPIIQTAGYMEREYQAPNVTGRLKIGTELVRETPKVFLIDVVAFLDWLEQRDDRLAVGAALQGLAGLQLQEALRLTWNKIDLTSGLVEISGEVKNKFRTRVVPIPERCIASLRLASQRQTASGVVDLHGPVVQSPLGCSYSDGIRSWCNYSEALREKIREWNPRLTWTSKDLRNCVPTFHKMEGSGGGDLLELYLGHAPRSVTMKHYVPRLASGSLGEQKALEKAMQAFRELIVNPIDRAIESLPQAKILMNFELGAIANQPG